MRFLGNLSGNVSGPENDLGQVKKKFSRKPHRRVLHDKDKIMKRFANFLSQFRGSEASQAIDSRKKKNLV